MAHATVSLKTRRRMQCKRLINRRPVAIKDLKLSSGSSGVSTVNCSEGIYLSELIR